jgi:hypothetical protein
MKRIFIIILALFTIFNTGFAQRKSSYVKGYVTKNGRVVKGHSRKGVSTNPSAQKRRNYSKAYYQRNKWRYKKK